MKYEGQCGGGDPNWTEREAYHMRLVSREQKRHVSQNGSGSEQDGLSETKRTCCLDLGYQTTVMDTRILAGIKAAR